MVNGLSSDYQHDFKKSDSKSKNSGCRAAKEIVPSKSIFDRTVDLFVHNRSVSITAAVTSSLKKINHFIMTSLLGPI